MAAYSKEQIAYVDETGIDTYLHREYGWSKRGVPLVGLVSGRRYKRMGIVAAQIGERIISPLLYEGAMDSTFFEMWFETQLLPCLSAQTVIVMDNASFHRKGKLYPLAKTAGMHLIFLPPYSPELNPIEHFWSWLKRQIVNSLSLHSAFQDAVCSAFQVR
jgi:transposase